MQNEECPNCQRNKRLLDATEGLLEALVAMRDLLSDQVDTGWLTAPAYIQAEDAIKAAEGER